MKGDVAILPRWSDSRFVGKEYFRGHDCLATIPAFMPVHHLLKLYTSLLIRAQCPLEREKNL